VTRSYGSGSIAEVRPGVYRLRVSAGADVITGRPRTISETYRGKAKDAQRRLGALAAEHGGRTGTAATVGELVERWLDTATIAQGTRRNYRQAANRIPDRMRAMPAARLAAHDLDQLYAALTRSGVGVDAVRHVHATISRALTQGVRWGWIGANVARNARPPTAPRSKATTLPDGAFARLLAATDDPQTRLWLRLAAVTVARRSEVLALRWERVDLAAGTVTIAGALEIDGTRKATKTGRARTVEVDAVTVEELRAWRVAQKARALTLGGKPGPWVLSDDPLSARPWRPDVATKRFARLAKSAGLVGVRLHDIRHDGVTAMLAAGVPVTAVAGFAGHSRVSTTLDVYGHVLDGQGRHAADVLGKRASGG